MTAAVLASVFAYRQREPSDVHPIRVSIRPPVNTLPSQVGDVESPPVISRDGRRIAFVARTLDGRTLLWLRPLDSLTAQPLPGTEDAAPVSPFWSPDGRSLAFTAARRLKRIDIDSGSLQVLAENVSSSSGTWSPDGTILFSRGIGIYRVSATGGAESLVISRSHSTELLFDPRFLPDGRHFLVYAVPNVVDPAPREVRIGALDSKETRALLSGSDLSMVEYAFPFLIFMRGGRVQAQRFDPVKLMLSGDAVPVPEQVSYNPDGYAALSVSDNGVLVYRTGLPARTRLAWFDRTGHETEGVDTPPGHIFSYSLSPDGRRLATLIDGPSNSGEELWLLTLSGGPPQRLPYVPGHAAGAVWSPDGSRIAFLLDDGGRDGAALMRQDLQSSAAPEPLFRSPHFLGVSSNGGNSPRWRSDGRELYYLQHDRSLMAVQVDGTGDDVHTQSPQRLFDVNARICGCFNFVPSPDGQRFLVNAFPNAGESQPLVVVLNWAADVERGLR